jgi:hypothetical protein
MAQNATRLATFARVGSLNHSLLKASMTQL